MLQIALLALVGFLGGVFGAMVGLGGGVFIIPVLTLFLDVPIHNAIAASLVAVVATSTTALEWAILVVSLNITGILCSSERRKPYSIIS